MNTFGTLFRISLFGESHGPGIGIIADGCPPGIPLDPSDFTEDLARRKAGAPGTTPRLEDDSPELLSGVYNGHTSGSPIGVLFRNKNIRPRDYAELRNTPRPGHADFAAHQRFQGFNDPRGGGHFSGRLTLALVTAGVIAKKIINPVSIHAKLIMAGGSSAIQAAVEEALKEGDSVGGLIECIAGNIPIGWGEPFFDSVESSISHLIFAIPAVKGIEFGSGFAAASMKGSLHNDPIIDASGKTATNNAGGISGGLTNGNDLIFRVAIKPTSSISIPQHSYSLETGRQETIQVKGRHDACIALRAPVVVEAVTAIALADLKLRFQTQKKITQ